MKQSDNGSPTRNMFVIDPGFPSFFPSRIVPKKKSVAFSRCAGLYNTVSNIAIDFEIVSSCEQKQLHMVNVDTGIAESHDTLQ